MLQKINLWLGRFICQVTKEHRKPYTVLLGHIWRIEFCNRCGKIIKNKKVGMTLEEHLRHQERNSGNQIW